MRRNDITRVALTWAPEGRRGVGRPKENWRTVEKERNQLGYKARAKAEVAAQKTEEHGRREMLVALFSTRRQGNRSGRSLSHKNVNECSISSNCFFTLHQRKKNEGSSFLGSEHMPSKSMCRS